MKLYAISDIHLNHRRNRDALEALAPQRQMTGSLSAATSARPRSHLEFRIASAWVSDSPGSSGCPATTSCGPRRTIRERWLTTQPAVEAKYRALVEVCRRRGALTPEDPYVVWPGPGGPHLICPLFLLYDYSFGPKGFSPAQALQWARESGLECADEHMLHPDPYPTRQDWCAARCALSERRIEAALAEAPHPTVLINHFPLRRELAVLPRIPRFTIWCGTERTTDWHQRFGAKVVIFGHLHIRQTRHIDGVRFEEVSLGYPRDWRPELGVRHYLRQILPEPARP